MPLDKMKLQGDLHDIESLNFSGTFGLFHVTREVLVGGEGAVTLVMLVTLHCHHQNDSALRWAGMKAILLLRENAESFW